MLLQGENVTPDPKTAPISLPPPRPKLRVEPWHDALIDEVGYDPRSDYVEAFWLPVLGPSTTFLLRHFTIQLMTSPDGLELDIEDTARSLGLGERLNQNSPFAHDKALRRLRDGGVAWATVARHQGSPPPAPPPPCTAAARITVGKVRGHMGHPGSLFAQ